MSKTLQSTLRMTLLDEVSGPAKALTTALNNIKGMAASNAAALAAMRGRMLESIGVGYALAQGLSAPVKAAIGFESAMSDVAKVVDFKTPEGFAALSQQIREMSLRIPIAAEGIAQIVAAAGQSGIAVDELAKFADIAAKVSTAWDMSAGETGEALAKLKTALGLTLADTQSLADAINHLGNNSAASAPNILEVVKRVAPMAQQFGMSAEQVAALGAAMVGSGFEADVAATSILNVGRALTKGASATPRQVAAFKTLGLTAKNVAKSMQKDSVGTLQDVLTRINKVPAAARAALISDLFGDEARALGPLISNGDLLAQVLGLVADKSNYAGSAAKEYETASERTANKLALFRNRVTDLGISIGNTLLPAVNAFVDKVGPMITSVSELVQRFPMATQAIIGLTAGTIGLSVAMTGLQFAFLWMKGGILSAAIPLVSFTSHMATAATQAVALQSALGAMNGKKLTGLQTVSTALRGMAFAIPGVSALSGVLGAIGGAIAGLTAPVWLGIAAGVAAVAAAGFAVYKYWDRLTSIFSGVASRIGEELKPAFDLIQPALDAMAPAVEAVGTAFSTVWEKVSSFFSSFSEFFGREVLTEDQKAGFEKAGFDVADRMINAVKSKIGELVDWFRGLPARILEAIGTIDISSRIKATLPSWLGGETSNPPNPPIDGARAAGGPVSAGKTYLVGERGPELFSPGRSGFISPNEVYAASGSAQSSGQASGTGPNYYLDQRNSFYISGVADPDAAARKVADIQANSIRSALEGAYTD